MKEVSDNKLFQKWCDSWKMKSGYGIDADSKTSVNTSGSPNFITDYTQAPNEISTFSQFGFLSTNTDWHFKKNIDSY